MKVPQTSRTDQGEKYELKMKEKLINKIQGYLQENKKDGLLIYETDHLEPYFNRIVGVPCSIETLLYIPAEEKPQCIVANMEIGAIRSTGLFEEENLVEYGKDKDVTSFKAATEKFLKDLKKKKVLINFSEEDPLVDQLPHAFFKEYLQNLNVKSSEELWQNIKLGGQEKKYSFTTSLEVRKARLTEFKNKISDGFSSGFLMINGTNKASSQTYACYLLGFLKNQKYAIAVKPKEEAAIVHEDEALKEGHPFDKILTYKNAKEFREVISEFFKDVKSVKYDDRMTEGNYRLAKKTLGDKLRDSEKNLVDELLSVKLPEEVKEIEKACRINDEVFDYLEGNLKAGMSEKEISKLIEKKELSYPEVLEPFFSSLVAAGENGANIHHLNSDYKVQKGDLLLVDMGVRLKTGMGSDTTCMYYFGDSIPERVRKYDEVMDKAMLAAIKKVEPGNPKMDADLAARAEITKHYPNFGHSLGHGVDVKCHGSSKAMMPTPTGFFEKGGVFSIEPGIYIKEEDVKKNPKKYPKIEGFRKEILIGVTKDGAKKISEIPKLRLIKR